VLWRYGDTNKCPSLSSENGNICKIRLLGVCEYPTEGRWDASESKCLQCSGNIEDKICGDTAGIYVQYGTGICTQEGNQKCESACGASSGCDEVVPGSVSCDIYGNQLTIRVCDSNCNYSSDEYVCEPANCGVSQSCGGTTYYCVYDGKKWVWSTTKPPDFCCSDADCSGKACGNYTAYCDTTSYRCACRTSCSSNSECASGYCCKYAADASLSKECVGKGTTVSAGRKSYLCDPPEWSAESPKVNKETKPTIFDLILNFFKNIFS